MICTREQADVASAEEGAKKQQSRRTHKNTAQRPGEGLCGTSIFFGEAPLSVFDLRAAPKHSINPAFLRTSDKHLSEFIYCMIPLKHPKESS